MQLPWMHMLYIYKRGTLVVHATHTRGEREGGTAATGGVLIRLVCPQSRQAI